MTRTGPIRVVGPGHSVGVSGVSQVSSGISLVARSVAILLTAVSLAAASLAATSPVAADPASDKRAQAERIAAEIGELGEKESELAEAYNEAVLAQEQVAVELASAKARHDGTSAKVAQAGAALRARAIDAYISGTVQTDLTLQPAENVGAADSLMAAQYARTLASVDADALDVVRAARLQLGEQREALEAKQKQADAAVSSVDQARRQVAGIEARLGAMQSQVNGELTVLVSQAEERRQAAAATRAEAEIETARQEAVRPAPTSPSPPGVSPRVGAGGGGVSVGAKAGGASRPAGPPPAAKGGASAAVAYAHAQLGKPYRWGGTGPNSFDCSGLTMMSWKAGGVSLPRTSSAQYQSARHISLADLQPGDLVWRPGHIGLYIGGGKMIAAPYSGTVVRIAPISSGMRAARP